MKGVSFAQRYFFLIGACLLKMQKIDSLTLVRIGIFGTAHGWGAGGKKVPPP